MNVRRLLLVHGVMLFIALISIMALSFFQGAAIKDYEPIKHCYQQVGNIPCKIPSLKEYKPYCIYPPAIINKSNGTKNPLIDTYTINNQTFENDFARLVKQYTLLRVEFFRRITENCGDDSVYEQLKKDGELKNVIDYFDIIQSCYQKLQECQTALVYSKHINSTRYELGSLNAVLFTDGYFKLYNDVCFYLHEHNDADTNALETVIEAMLYTIFNLSNICVYYDQKLRDEHFRSEHCFDIDLSVYDILKQKSFSRDALFETAILFKAGKANKHHITKKLQALMLGRYKFELKLENE